jgi:hypothetical protein
LLTVGSSWIGSPLPEDEEKQLEENLKAVLAQLRSTCELNSREIEDFYCNYWTAYSKESRCPSDRKK